MHAPPQDPFLSFSHTFSLKSTHIGGQNSPKMGPCPPTENPGSGPEVCCHLANGCMQLQWNSRKLTKLCCLHLKIGITLRDIVLPCIFGWKLCIHALFGLWEYLKTEQNFKFLLTNRLNQDCAENLFSIICGKGGFRDNPDTVQFKDAFKYMIADKLFVKSGKSNFKVDNDKILLDISSIAMAKYVKPMATNVEKLPTTNVALVITPPLPIPTKNIAAYLSGYLLQKIPIENCEECTDQMLLT